MFEDRKDAGRKLAKKLEEYRGKDAVLLALPRGGVVLGREIADALKLPLDIVVTRKIGHPGNPEYAICAIDEKGTLLCNEEERKAVNNDWLKGEAERQRKEAERRVKLYRGKKKPAELKGKIAIIVDDGIATGLTMRLAVMAVRAQKPERIIVAVPVASPEAVHALIKENGVDDIIVLLSPKEFVGAIGAHYMRFDQVEDEEVIKLLK